MSRRRKKRPKAPRRSKNVEPPHHYPGPEVGKAPENWKPKGTKGPKKKQRKWTWSFTEDEK